MLGMLDLSIVTDRLVAALNEAANLTAIWSEDGISPPQPPGIKFSGTAPDVRTGAAATIGRLFLFHVAPDKFYRNTPPQGGRGQRNSAQPLALNLFYLLSASAETHNLEQQAMSIAVKYFHEHPILTAQLSGVGRQTEFTVTLEPQTVDEMGRLWQSFACPARLSVVYRVGVVFVEPEVVPEPAKPVEQYTLTASPSIVSGGLRIAVACNNLDPLVAPLVFIDEVELTEATTDPPINGTFRIVGSRQLDIAFPADTARGRHVLRVQPKPYAPPHTAADTLAVELLVDVP
jgi:hypothetical protein